MHTKGDLLASKSVMQTMFLMSQEKLRMHCLSLCSIMIMSKNKATKCLDVEIRLSGTQENYESM